MILATGLLFSEFLKRRNRQPRKTWTIFEKEVPQTMDEMNDIIGKIDIVENSVIHDNVQTKLEDIVAFFPFARVKVVARHLNRTAPYKYALDLSTPGTNIKAPIWAVCNDGTGPFIQPLIIDVQDMLNIKDKMIDGCAR